MNKLYFNIHFCGMNSETFTKQIMIYKPNYSINKMFDIKTLNELKITTIDELVNYIKTDLKVKEMLGNWGMENFSFRTTYIEHHDYLLGLKEDKSISEVFHYFNTTEMTFDHFVVGGASIHNETKYRFTVHSDEKIHEHTPHVHVSKSGVEIRYSLEDLTPMDSLVNPHKRDSKKIILPFLKNNQSKLLEMWNHNMSGYYTPDISENGCQFYSES